MLTVIRIIMILGAGASVAITTRMLADHWLYSKQVIVQSSLWAGVTMILTMFFLMFLTIGRIGYPPIWWRIFLEPMIIGLSITAGIMRYKEIQYWNKRQKEEKRPEKSPEEENLERLRHATNNLLTSQPPELDN